VFSELEDFDGLSFQGGYDHVGSQLYPREGMRPSPTVYRFALIHYTPQRAAAAEKGDTKENIICAFYLNEVCRS
jgi:hypothetical protein